MRIVLLAAMLLGFAQSPTPELTAPATFTAVFRTTSGNFAIAVHREWAPHGADRFYTLVKSGYYTGNAIYRVVPGFVAQWGLSPDPKQSAAWEKAEIPDDPVAQSNLRGMVSFAASGPHSRTTQVFVNLASNARLDKLGFAPFGEVVAGLPVVEQLDGEYGERPDQRRILAQGAAYLTAAFPRLDVIYSATIRGGTQP